ncbi:MAG: hypothetical protein HUK22_06015, partial [Thermoguttaceae bacterium]|nr:hypothetical protein [Thermoguttaceae bacterium]
MNDATLPQKIDGTPESPEGTIIVCEDGTRKALRKRPPLLKLENLNVVFGENQVLRDVNLSIRRGETLAVKHE